MILAAVMTALTAAATMMLTLPLPPTGFVHLGDGMVLLSGWLLGPVWGAAAAGLGSALADQLRGYAMYAPGTFAVKALTAAVCALLAAGLSRRMKNGILPCLIGGTAAELVMAAGYFGYESLILGYGAAALASVPGNLMQGLTGLCIFFLLSAVFRKYRITDAFAKKR